MAPQDERLPPLVAASLLAAHGGRLADEVRAMEKAGADWLHIDVMDGHFVPNLTFGPSIVAAAVNGSNLYRDVHLMVTDPQRWLRPFADAGAHQLTVHAEVHGDLAHLLGRIGDLGCARGVSINPDTPTHAIEPLLDAVDTVLVMSVQPGFGGQSYDARATAKIAALRALRQTRALSFRIEVDGGINTQTVAQAFDAGADVCVAGTALFGQQDYARAVAGLKQAALAPPMTIGDV